MKRRYSISDYQQAVSIIRALVPEVAITTDIIVGFPGETSAEFEESFNFCQQMGFARIHVFSYSPRQETQAARMPNQIDTQVKRERSEQMTILWEKQSGDGIWSGHTDNYIKVYARSDRDLTNKLLPVKIERLWKDGVWGEIEE